MQIMTLKSVFTHNVTVAICLSLTWRPPSSLSLSLSLSPQPALSPGWVAVSEQVGSVKVAFPGVAPCSRSARAGAPPALWR